jgi:hypothetical protein
MINNDKDAFLLALQLAVTIPDGQQDKFQDIVEMAENLATRLTPEEIEECKAIVEKEVQEFGGQVH